MVELTYISKAYKNEQMFDPINENYYLILTLDFDQYDFDKIIKEKIHSLFQREKESFVIKKNE